MNSKKTQDVATGAATVVLIALLWGSTTHAFWMWFAVPAGMSPINLWQAFGITLLFWLLNTATRGVPTTKKRQA